MSQRKVLVDMPHNVVVPLEGMLCVNDERLRTALEPLKDWPAKLAEVANVFFDVAQLLGQPKDAELGLRGSTYQMATDAKGLAQDLGQAIRRLHSLDPVRSDDLERLCSVQETTRVLKATAGIALRGWPGRAQGVLSADLRDRLAQTLRVLENDLLPTVSTPALAPAILRRATQMGRSQGRERD